MTNIMNKRGGLMNVIKNHFGSKMIITNEYKINGNKYIDVYFPEYDCTVKNKSYSNFKRGSIKCPYERRTYGVGYLGEGKHKPSKNGKHVKVYLTWRDMLERCYSPKSLKRRPTYENCTVCDEWLCYQNFAEWYYSNYYEIDNEKMHLDKDILYKGNKIYSPDTCVFVPAKINSLFKSIKINGMSKYNDKYQVQGNDEYGEHVYIGSFDTKEEALKSYKNFKEFTMKRIGEIYEKSIPKKVYDILYNYTWYEEEI